MKNITISCWILAILFGTDVLAQSGRCVSKVEKLDFSGHDLRFSKDGCKLFYTSSNYTGLYMYDVSSAETVEISNQRGAGFNLTILEDGVVYRDKKQRKNMIYSISTGESSFLENRDQKEKTEVSVKASDDLTSILVTNSKGETTEIAPLGRADYLNVTLSPDKSKILFRVSSLGSFITNLKGEILTEFGNVEFPSWAAGDEVLFTKTKDDGYDYLSSEVYLSTTSGEILLDLTKEIEAIAIYPSINSEGDRVVFNTPEGEVYLLHLERE